MKTEFYNTLTEWIGCPGPCDVMSSINWSVAPSWFSRVPMNLFKPYSFCPFRVAKMVALVLLSALWYLRQPSTFTRFWSTLTEMHFTQVSLLAAPLCSKSLAKESLDGSAETLEATKSRPTKAEYFSACISSLCCPAKNEWLIEIWMKNCETLKVWRQVKFFIINWNTVKNTKSYYVEI